ncbi:MAG TPA: hypothetical protein DEB09_03240 [Candidatus Magasanikbacteria bacterium]|nr:hypothetical protein [Candidatus Magasanikbacteria bacterium]
MNDSLEASILREREARKNGAYHKWFANQEQAEAFCQRENNKPEEEKTGWSGNSWIAEQHEAGCEHAIDGWFVVAVNEQGNMWTGAPWESCEPCATPDEE